MGLVLGSRGNWVYLCGYRVSGAVLGKLNAGIVLIESAENSPNLMTSLVSNLLFIAVNSYLGEFWMSANPGF